MAGHVSDYASLPGQTLCFSCNFTIYNATHDNALFLRLMSLIFSLPFSMALSLPPSFAISWLYPPNPRLIDRIIKPTLRVNITLGCQSKTTSPIRAKDSQIRLELSSNSPPARAAHRLFSKPSPRRLHRVGQGVLLSRCIDSRVRPEDNRYLRRVVDSCAQETLSVRERCVEVVAPDRVSA
jgi:hypothetical protein